MKLVDLFTKDKEKALVAALVAESDMNEENITRAAIRLYQSVRERAKRGESMAFVDAEGRLIPDGPLMLESAPLARSGNVCPHCVDGKCVRPDDCMTPRSQSGVGNPPPLYPSLAAYQRGDYRDAPDSPLPPNTQSKEA